MGAGRRMPGIHTHPQTTSPHQGQAVWGSTLGNSSTSSLTLMVKATWRGPLLPTSQTRFTLLQARAARELSVMSVFCKTETAEWDEGRSGGSWGEGTASEGEKPAEKLAVHAESPGEDGKQVISLCTELFAQLVPHH